ncbi:cation:proton antiporter [Streptomyces sp. NBC_01275]|uniref:cation:proton antiporter n=1 Tax=Streptomyces sp. NBC_01275 TaxID=2903807 RepID=UPI0022531B03|nr:cation:proton antiporter [Streptomyces sp. NBC_01275]MCX4762863.1 cation:proton antiporter [Streptomyces sp. NBC_01275]
MSGGSAWTGAAVAAVTAGYALFSRRLASTPVSAPMVFTGFGVLIGPIGLDVLDLGHDVGPVLTLVEAALALLLFTDSMTVRRRDLRTGGFLPLRLLAIGLPLSIGAGWLLAWPLFPGLTLWEFALLGAVLAPTDAALGKTASSSPRVPALVRHGLNVESGLNDGLALPFFLMFLAAIPGTIASEEGVHGVFWRALVVSTAVGLAFGWVGGWLSTLSRSRGWVTGEWQQVVVLAVAFCAYSVATALDGSGFIATWMGGFAFGVALRQGEPAGEESAGVEPAGVEPAGEESAGEEPAGVEPAGEESAGEEPAKERRPADLAEYVGGLLGTLSFLVFGAVLLGPALEHLNWRIITYAVLSLTVVRMLPVALALAGTGMRLPTVAYVGWFGPRGLASVVFGLLVVEDHVPGIELLGQVIAVTIGLSILLHGMSAPYFADRYGNWYDAAQAAAPDLHEAQDASEGFGRQHGGSRRLR